MTKAEREKIEGQREGRAEITAKEYRFKIDCNYAPGGIGVGQKNAAGDLADLKDWDPDHIADALRDGIIEEA